MKRYQRLIDRALEHIKSQQSPDGSFESLSGFSPEDFSGAIPRRTTFFTANILACLQNIHCQTNDVQDTAAKFLLAEKSQRWSFNYWAREVTKEHTVTGACAALENAELSPLAYSCYPDDLDDTFAALAALARHDAGIIDGHASAAIAKLLTARETREGGPYRTWLVPDDAAAKWQDVDVVVNSTIGYFLSLIGVTLPRLEHFIDDAVDKNMLVSPYYPGMFHVGYFLSRFYKNNAMAEQSDAHTKLADMITERIIKDAGGDTPLEQAMVISSLFNLGYTERITRAMIDLLAARLEREGFLPYAFCIDPARDGKRCYAGASALTAAFCAQALTQYAAACHNNADAGGTQSVWICATPHIPTIDDHVRGLARASCKKLGPDLRATALAQIEKISDKKITTLAYEFREVLYKNGSVVTLDIIEQLSLANLYGWMAYEIYDDAQDGDMKDNTASSSLPAANFFLRALTEIYSALDAHIAGAKALFYNTMDQIDNANAWEQIYCRVGTAILPSFGDHQTLADRSIGHAMGPLAELLCAGYTASSHEYKNVEQLFRHYLIARQIHDDAHDWVDDLQNGRVNSVGTLVLRRFQEKNCGTVQTITASQIDVRIIPKLRKLFWEEILDDVVNIITCHITAAREARETSGVLADSDFMEHPLRSLASATRRAAKERNEALVFLNDYKGSSPTSLH